MINYIIMPRKPKYGYARDIFGRVQDRDRYKEDSTEKLDYDYSSYDREDDHSNIYDIYSLPNYMSRACLLSILIKSIRW